MAEITMVSVDVQLESLDVVLLVLLFWRLEARMMLLVHWAWRLGCC